MTCHKGTCKKQGLVPVSEGCRHKKTCQILVYPQPQRPNIPNLNVELDDTVNETERQHPPRQEPAYINIDSSPDLLTSDEDAEDTVNKTNIYHHRSRSTVTPMSWIPA